MPTWLNIALWFIWWWWATYELYWFLRLMHHNTNNYLKAKYTEQGAQITLLFIVSSAFWLSWNIWG